MRRLLHALLLILPAAPALALDYHSVTEAAVLYDAPSQKAKPLFVIVRGTPVESVVTLDAWVKVRDAKGDLAWIERQFLSEKRTLIVRAERATVRERADEAAPMVIEAERDVLLDLVEAAPPGWARVKHRDGKGGFVKAGDVWGL